MLIKEKKIFDLIVLFRKIKILAMQNCDRISLFHYFIISLQYFCVANDEHREILDKFVCFCLILQRFKLDSLVLDIELTHGIIEAPIFPLYFQCIVDKYEIFLVKR